MLPQTKEITDRQHNMQREESWRKYGIKLTVKQYDFMFQSQGGVCAICKHPPKGQRLNVDHDHQTGRVRCLACYRCNKFLIGRHTAETARKVLQILESDFDGRNIITKRYKKTDSKTGA